MDDQRFDRLVRAFTTPAHRRPALGRILASAVGWIRLPEREAGGRKNRKDMKKKKGGAALPPPPPPARPSPPPVNR